MGTYLRALCYEVIGFGIGTGKNDDVTHRYFSKLILMLFFTTTI